MEHARGQMVVGAAFTVDSSGDFGGPSPLIPLPAGGERERISGRANPTFATGGGDFTEMAENRPLTPKGLHQSQSLSSSPF